MPNSFPSHSDKRVLPIRWRMPVRRCSRTKPRLAIRLHGYAERVGDVAMIQLPAQPIRGASKIHVWARVDNPCCVHMIIYSMIIYSTGGKP